MTSTNRSLLILIARTLACLGIKKRPLNHLSIQQLQVPLSDFT